MMKSATIAVALFSTALATPALSATTAFLSRNGAGTICTLAAPCTSMDAAIAAAGAGGEVVCLDKYKYGSANNIAASVTISCGDGLWDTSLPLVNISTPANSKVVIEGLVGDCLGAVCGTIMNFSGQGDLELRRVSIGHSGGSGATGLSFAPSGPASLTVTDSYFYDMPQYGILVKPASGATSVTIRNSTLSRNGQHGVAFQPGVGANVIANLVNVVAAGNSVGVSASDRAHVTIDSSAMNQNAFHGFLGYSASAASVLNIKNSVAHGNASHGIVGSGAAAYVTMTKTLVTGNGAGVAGYAGASVLSFGDNQLFANGVNGAPTGSVAQQ